MKKLLILLVSCFIALNAYSQNNRAKLGLFGLTYKNINLKYERVLAPNATVQVNLGFRPSSRLRAFESFQIEGTESIDIDVQHNTFTFIPEFRYYLNKKDNAKGVYVGANFDYMRLGLLGNHESEFSYNGDITLNYIGGGLNFGTQWILDNGFTIDWHILGLGYGSSRVRFGFESDDPAISFSQILDDANERLEGIPGLEDLIDAVFDDTSLSAVTPPFGLPRFRTGISLGYAF